MGIRWSDMIAKQNDSGRLLLRHYFYHYRMIIGTINLDWDHYFTTVLRLNGIENSGDPEAARRQ